MTMATLTAMAIWAPVAAILLLAAAMAAPALSRAAILLPAAATAAAAPSRAANRPAGARTAAAANTPSTMGLASQIEQAGRRASSVFAGVWRAVHAGGCSTGGPDY